LQDVQSLISMASKFIIARLFRHCRISP